MRMLSKVIFSGPLAKIVAEIIKNKANASDALVDANKYPAAILAMLGDSRLCLNTDSFKKLRSYHAKYAA